MIRFQCNQQTHQIGLAGTPLVYSFSQSSIAEINSFLKFFLVSSQLGQAKEYYRKYQFFMGFHLVYASCRSQITG